MVKHCNEVWGDGGTLAGVTPGRETEEVCHAPLGLASQWPLASNIAADDMTTQHNPGTSNPAFQAGDWV